MNPPFSPGQVVILTATTDWLDIPVGTVMTVTDCYPADEGGWWVNVRRIGTDGHTHTNSLLSHRFKPFTHIRRP